MRKRIFLSYFILILICISIMGFMSIRISRQTNIEIMKDNQYKSILLLKECMSYYTEEGFSEYVNKYKEQLGARITIINKDGVVIADSDVNTENMDNHNNREEVVAARKEGKGLSIRYSKTLNTDMMYSAVTLNHNDSVLRISIPLTNIDKNISSQSRTLFITILAIFLIASLQAWRFSKDVTKPVLEIARLSKTISQGDFSKRIKTTTHSEMNQLVDAFNTMASRLETSISEIKDKNLKLESAMTSMLNGIITVDLDYNIVMINPAAKRLFNINIDVTGSYVLEAVRNQHIYNLIEKVISTYDQSTLETEIEGEENKIIRINASPVADQEELIGVVLVMQDVTELRRLERIRTDFVANVSHELKTPLTSIQGFVETLKEGNVKDKKTLNKFLNIIFMEAERLSRLINDLLSISRLESKYEDDSMIESVDINKVVREIFEVTKNYAQSKNVQLKANIKDSIDLLANRDQIKQMLLNLVDNAIKYNSDGGSVTVKTRDFMEYVEIVVKDTGIGIEKEHIPRLFERFYRVDKGRSRSLGGTGLGLAIVKHIVKSMNGRIEVNSEPDNGTQFRILLKKNINKNINKNNKID